ncbi:MAG: DUF6262 family protein [Actinomycetes bacterium]|jgi:hypothetical protein
MSADDLARASRARTESAEHRARQGLSALSRSGRPVTFASVAREAGVSTDFLYKHAELRMLIADLRARPRGVPGQASVPVAANSSAVRALSTQLKEQRARYEAELATLRTALATAQAENLALRRKLGGRPSGH